MTITLRQESQTGTTTKGSTLTYAELDNNFIDLLTNKILPLQVDADTGSVTVGQAQSNGVFTITGGTGITTSVTEDSAGNANLTITQSVDQQGIIEIVGGSNIEATQTDSAGAVTLEVTNPAVLNVDGAVVFTAKNTSGETIEKGEAVYISGISGNTTTIAKADANDSAKMPAFGLANEQIVDTASGEIITFGPITNLDTSFHTEGEELFVSTDPNDSAGGSLTSTAPTGESSFLQKIAKVTRSDQSAGSLFVMGAGRSNATPNLNDGNIFIGNASNQITTSNLQTLVESYSINNVVEDTSPQLGGTLDAQSNNFTNVGTINTHTIPGGTGTFALTSDIPTVIDTQIVGGTDITVTQPDSAGAFTVAYSGSAISNVVEDTTPQLGGTLDCQDNVVQSPDLKDYKETVYSLGTTDTPTITVSNGNVQSVTITSGLTLPAFSDFATGQSVTLLVSGSGTVSGTGAHKFAGGNTTLTTSSVVSIFYDGTTYWTSVNTDFQ